MRQAFFAGVLMFVLLSGCRTTRPDYSLFKSEQEQQTDSLWRQGFGYNNPNVDRIRSGQTPLNFDGEPNNFESAAKDVAGRAVGNAISFGIFEAVPAIYRGFRDKLQR